MCTAIYGSALTPLGIDLDLQPIDRVKPLNAHFEKVNSQPRSEITGWVTTYEESHISAPRRQPRTRH